MFMRRKAKKAPQADSQGVPEEGTRTEEPSEAASDSTSARPAQDSAAMSLWQIVAVTLIATVFSSMAGGAAGYYFALRAPVLPQVAVFDLDGAAQLAMAMQQQSGVDAQKFADVVTTKMKARLQEISDTGIVIIDKSSTVNAPHDLLIDPALIIAEAVSEMKNPTGENKPSGAAITKMLEKK